MLTVTMLWRGLEYYCFLSCSINHCCEPHTCMHRQKVIKWVFNMLDLSYFLSFYRCALVEECTSTCLFVPPFSILPLPSLPSNREQMRGQRCHLWRKRPSAARMPVPHYIHTRIHTHTFLHILGADSAGSHYRCYPSMHKYLYVSTPAAV